MKTISSVQLLDRVMSLYGNGTGTVSQVLCQNNTSERVSSEYNKEIAQFKIEYNSNPNGYGHIKNVRVEDHTAYFKSPALSEVICHGQVHHIHGRHPGGSPQSAFPFFNGCVSRSMALHSGENAVDWSPAHGDPIVCYVVKMQCGRDQAVKKNICLQ